jgi:gas vesicle protein
VDIAKQVKNMKTSSKVAVALGVGLAVGGLLGILYAPAKGAETREKFQRQRKKWRAQFDRGVRSGQDLLAKVAERMDETGD